MLGFIILLTIFFGAWLGMMGMADLEEVKKNWPKYRCRPNIMPFAAIYGHNTGENFQFCLSNMFGLELGEALGPVFAILGSMVRTLMTILQVANSIRIQLATLMGGIQTIFQNFVDRFKQLLAAVQQSAYRMKLIMGRLYGTFFAMIYMSISGMTALNNFTETVLFDFLDTFCFDPDTLVSIKGKGKVAVKEVKIGDIFEETGSKVTATFAFESDGQQMVRLPGNINVSTNHYVYSLGKWMQAGDHPLATPTGPWQGGTERPLICFNTSDHKIPIGHFVFLDYDETEEGDGETMNWIDSKLNGKDSSRERSYDYTTCVKHDTKLFMKDGSTKTIQEIQLGESLSTGRVVGIIQKQVDCVCELSLKESVAPGLCYWDKTQWVRAGDTLPSQQLEESQIYYSLVVLGTASFETENHTVMRDYVEVHSPDSEQFYASKVELTVKA
jgi:hypothetical protein